MAPKLGATYHLDDNSRIYGSWTSGYRSGGYNLRNTSFDPADTPGPFDEEEVNNYEIGYKSTHDWGRLNASIFYNEIDDMQRQLNNPGLDFYSNDGKWIFSLYGRNLLDNNWHGGDTQLPDTISGVPTGGTFSPLTAGIRYGAEVRNNFF